MILLATHEKGYQVKPMYRRAHVGPTWIRWATQLHCQRPSPPRVHARTWSPLAIPPRSDADEPGHDRRLGYYPQSMPDAADEKATSTASNRLIKRHFRLL